MIENMLFCSKKGKKKNNLTWRVCFLICLKRTSLTQQRTELKVKPLDREEGHTANRSLPSCRSPQAQKKAVHVGQPCAAASPQNPWAVTFGSCCGGGGSPSSSPWLCEEHPKRAGGLWDAFWSPLGEHRALHYKSVLCWNHAGISFWVWRSLNAVCPCGRKPRQIPPALLPLLLCCFQRVHQCRSGWGVVTPMAPAGAVPLLGPTGLFTHWWGCHGFNAIQTKGF